MTEPIRLPRDQYGHPIITPDLARQIVAMADVFGEENWQPLEKRIAALEASKSTGFIGEVITIGGSGKPAAQGDEAAVEQLRCWSVGYEYYYDAYFGPDAPFGNQQPTAASLAEALQDGARMVPPAMTAKDAEIARLKADLADAKLDAEKAKAERNGLHVKNYKELQESRAQVAVLAGLLREARHYVELGRAQGSYAASRDLARIDAALAAAGEGKA